MASTPISGDAAPVTLPGTIPPMPAVARVLRQFDRAKLGAAIEVMIALLDMTDPDPEQEGGTWPDDIRSVDRQHLYEDCEADGSEADTSWPEWHQRGRNKTTWAGHEMAGARGLGESEDDEQDDEPEDDDPAGVCDEDGVNTGSGEYWEHGRAYTDPGCPISDPGERAAQPLAPPDPVR